MFNHRFSNKINTKSKKLTEDIIKATVGSTRKTMLALVIVLTLSASTAMTGCSLKQNSKIDTTDGITNILDYVTVDFSGKNGEGTAYVNVDYNGIETEMVGGEEKLKEMDEIEDLSNLTKYINAVSSISFSIDKNEGLSNGDQVIVSVSYDNSAAQAAGVDFGNQSSKTYEVKGLKK